MSDESAGGRARRIRTQRLEAFSDGVFAIAATLLVLDVAIPAGSDAHALHAIWAQWPTYLTYVVSFATIGAIWLGHTVITEYLDRADPVLLRLNLLLLMLVAFLPFPTRLLGDYIGSDDSERIAVTIYGIALFVTVGMLSVLWRYALHAQLVRPDMNDDEVAALTDRLTPGLAGYVVLIALGWFLRVVAVYGYLAVALVLILPFRPPGRKRRRHPTTSGSVSEGS